MQQQYQLQIPRQQRQRARQMTSISDISKCYFHFYHLYSVGHKGKFGHEFLEFELRPNGRLRYANNSQYKSDTLIRKEVYVNDIVLEEVKRIIKESEIMKEDDKEWPQPDKVGRQELEVVLGNEHISFTTSKFGSFSEVRSSKDPEGLTVFYYLL